MTTYSIQIHYRTGDSFKSYDETSEVGSNWTNLEAAKESLRRIKDHYSAYTEYEDWRQPKAFDTKKFRGEPWFFAGTWSDEWKYRVVLVDDDLNPVDRSVFWCGYFETLYEARIVIPKVEDDDMVFRP